HGKAEKSRALSTPVAFSLLLFHRTKSTKFPVRLIEIFPVLRARPGRSTGGFELS
ncbi:hypothetical protein PanWU01x14_231290, partial [Parasponia andersonii]